METRDVLIDTSIIIDHLRKKSKTKSHFYRIVGNHNLFISTITLFELYSGATDKERLKDIKNIIAYVHILPFTSKIAKQAGEIFRSLKKENKLIEFRDLFIGATALAHDLPIMSLNEKHFNRIKELKSLKTL
jgi:tRNA(fMet)-specific endonuclease VapC